MTALATPVPCPTGCGRFLDPRSRYSRWCPPCTKRWYRHGCPGDGPPPARPPALPAQFRRGQPRGVRAQTRQRVGQMAALMGEGMSVSEAGQAMGLSPRATSYTASVMRRLDREAAASGEDVLVPAPPGEVWHWQDAAACRGREDLFLGRDSEVGPEREVRETRGRSLCGVCPVRGECLEEALRNRDWQDIIWGGLDGVERRAEYQRRLKRARREVAA